MSDTIDEHTLLILQTGDTLPEIAAHRGPFAAWIRDGVGDAWPGKWATVDVRVVEPRDEWLGAAGWILTGSSSSVTERAPWMLATEAALRKAVLRDLPVLGICFGHQLLGQALGGEVARNPKGREIGTVTLRLLGHDPIVEGLDRETQVNATHVDTLVRMPPGAKILGETDLEPHAIFAVGSARGVQFHPEIDGEIMRGYLRGRRPLLEPEGFAVDAMIESAVDCPAGSMILRHFANRFVKRG